MEQRSHQAKGSIWYSKAFTLVELVIVIAVIGILAAVAIPRFIDIRTEAYVAQRDGIVGNVRSGILIAATKNQVTSASTGTFPPNLEATWGGITGGNQKTTATACDVDPCFELVLSTPVSDSRWSQETATSYKFNPPVGTAATYTYDATAGTLQ